MIELAYIVLYILLIIGISILIILGIKLIGTVNRVNETLDGVLNTMHRLDKVFLFIDNVMYRINNFNRKVGEKISNVINKIF